MVDCLKNLQQVATELPVESLAGAFLKGMNAKGMLNNPSIAVLSGFSEDSIQEIAHMISRLVAAHFIYPQVAPVCALINSMLGVVHITIASVQRFKTQDPASYTSEEWKAIALNIHKGLSHLLIAGYDFGIAFLLKQNQFSLGGLTVCVMTPVFAYQWHQKIYKKPGEPDVPAPVSTQQDLATTIASALPAQIPIPQASSSTSHTTPEPAPAPSATVSPTYLENTCLIYVIAKRITLGIMPKPAGEQDSNALPDFGL